MQGFRFYDQERLIYNKKEYIGDTINYSPWYFFGERLTREDIAVICKDNRKFQILLSNMEYNKIKCVCHTQDGSYLPMEDNDMTIEEYKEKVGFSKKIK